MKRCKYTNCFLIIKIYYSYRPLKKIQCPASSIYKLINQQIMKPNYLILGVLLCLSSWVKVDAKLRLPALFTSNMVLQQQSEVPFWGEASPNKTVKITTSWDKKTIETKADLKGYWRTTVSTPAYGGPFTIEITDGNRLKLENVMIGEVWICLG